MTGEALPLSGVQKVSLTGSPLAPGEAFPSCGVLDAAGLLGAGDSDDGDDWPEQADSKQTDANPAISVSRPVGHFFLYLLYMRIVALPFIMNDELARLCPGRAGRCLRFLL